MSAVKFMQFDLGKYQTAFEELLEKAHAEGLVQRIWQRDHKLWNPNPDEIHDRLGWLDIADRMESEIPALQSFAEEAKAERIRQVLLLGMGGSSLAPEVFSKIIGPAEGYPRLAILDSSDPDAVRASIEVFDPAQTLYVVSTKSGGTTETLSFFKTFYNQALDALGRNRAGKHFIAITDPGSKLVELAKQNQFRRIFLNDPNIGGRYSALSYFGLVPAGLLGLDLEILLQRAIELAKLCRQTPEHENPGVRLGLALASLAKAGRDKATFLAPKSLASFGDWVEQLIAESTGKAGTGILPVVGESRVEPTAYREDRVFLQMQLAGEETSESLEALASAGHPWIRLEWQDLYDLGAQYFLWEFATAVAGYGLGIHPFNQPNVEAAKVRARRFMDEYAKSGKLPKGEGQKPSGKALLGFLQQAEAGDYIALQAYVNPTTENHSALQDLRELVQRKTKLASTLGFGPRFLHSTGQLHKGDGGNGLFVQFVSLTKGGDLPIPVEAGAEDSEISYGVLKQAQALGDAQALRQAGRRVLTLEVAEDFSGAVQRLILEMA